MTERHVDALIIGAGIAGLLLARELRQRGWRTAVAHDPTRPGASEAAVGLLNPVRGQRCTLAWRAPEIFAAAREVYAAIEATCGQPILRSLPVVRAFASARERVFFERRASAIAAAGFACNELRALPTGLRGTMHGAVSIDGGGALDPRALTEWLRAELRETGVLVARRCTAQDLDVGAPRIVWQPAGIEADRVILAGGAGDIAASLAGPLPLRPVRGESLLVRAPALDATAAFVCGHHLAPVAPGLWSCGGTKTPGDSDPRATPEGRAELEQFLQDRLGVPWEIVGHWGGVRAATLDTKPLMGRIGGDARVLVFNGLGSQGFSAGPWLARLMADHLVHGSALPPEVDPGRPGAHRAPRAPIAESGVRRPA